MGLVERDYVMRLVKQIAELLARALKLQLAKKHDEAAEVLESGCLTLFGMDWKTLAWADSASAADLLKDAKKVSLFASLVEERAKLHVAAGEPAEAESKFQHAYELYREAKDAEGAARCDGRFDAGRLPAKYR